MDTYEKKYKEALERAKGIHSFSSDIAEIKRMEQIFPELAESENERIRKVQLDYWRSVGGKEWHGVPVQETIAWLEKQSEHKPYGQKEECFNCQFNYAGHCKGYCELKRQDKSTFDQCKQEGDKITTNPDGTHFNLSQLERVVKAETPEESLGISSEEYNKIVNECIFGELKETGKESNFNDRLDPLIDEEIDLWIKENRDIHHDNNDIVELMRDMAYYVATLTRNLYRQKSKWIEEDEHHWMMCVECVKECATQEREDFSKTIDWLKSLKHRLQ